MSWALLIQLFKIFVSVEEQKYKTAEAQSIVQTTAKPKFWLIVWTASLGGQLLESERGFLLTGNSEGSLPLLIRMYCPHNKGYQRKFPFNML